MTQTILILNALVVNEGKITPTDVFIKDGFIEQIGNNLSHFKTKKVIDATGKYLLPGVIDDQVHFHGNAQYSAKCSYTDTFRR
jgi:dihydroorotase